MLVSVLLQRPHCSRSCSCFNLNRELIDGRITSRVGSPRSSSGVKIQGIKHGAELLVFWSSACVARLKIQMTGIFRGFLGFALLLGWLHPAVGVYNSEGVVAATACTRNGRHT